MKPKYPQQPRNSEGSIPKEPIITDFTKSNYKTKDKEQNQNDISSSNKLNAPPINPPKVIPETLHWKDTPRRIRRMSLPSGVKLMEGVVPSDLPDIIAGKY